MKILLLALMNCYYNLLNNNELVKMMVTRNRIFKVLFVGFDSGYNYLEFRISDFPA